MRHLPALVSSLANRPSAAIETMQALRAKIAGIESRDRPQRPVLPFDVTPLDAALPEGGLAFGALHEVCGGLTSGFDGAATLFAAGIAARGPGRVLWCLRRPDLFAPALSQAGLDPDRVIYAEAGDEKSVLACFEEGLRHGGLGSVVAEVSRLSMTASRRLQLCAEATGTIGIALRRGKRTGEAAEADQPTAAMTRWRITALPSVPLAVAGVGRARWRVELVRCRGREAAEFILEACDETGRLALPADLADRSAAPKARRRRAAS